MDRLIVNLGDNKIVCIGSGIYSNRYKKIFDNAVADAISDGTLLIGRTIDWQELLKSRAIIYEYNCSFSGDDISSLFEVNVKDVSGIEPYDRIIILPSADGSSLDVMFNNSVTGSTAVYSLSNSDISTRCYNACTSISDENDIEYISTLLNGFNIFSQNQFIPIWNDDREYKTLEGQPQLNDTSAIEDNAGLFFTNPVSRQSSRLNDVYTFSDENTVVKYSPNGIFEYSNYKPAGLSLSNNFRSNYAAALAQLKKDKYITNEYYLSSFDTDSDGNYIFYFNYKINGLSLVPSAELKEQLGLNSFIEVTVGNGRVSKYRKYAYSYFEQTNTRVKANVSYVAAIDKLYLKLYGDGETQPVEHIRLKYVATNGRFGLQWVITVNSQDYIIPATQEEESAQTTEVSDNGGES
jgi:hypothetical protein